MSVWLELCIKASVAYFYAVVDGGDGEDDASGFECYNGDIGYGCNDSSI